MKQHLIPEQARDRIRACVGSEDSMKFKTCWEVHTLWFKLGPGIIASKMESEGWKPGEARGKAHRWFLSSLAADAGLGYQSMLNRERVGSSWMARGYHGGENENISYQKLVCLHANAEKGLDGLILKEVLEERIAWVQQVADENFGQPPSVLDIQKQYRKNGEKPEWLLLWKKIIRIAEKMLKLENVPEILKGTLELILSHADVGCTGGKPQTQKNVSTADTKYEGITVIYKDKSGYTGAGKERRGR